MKRTFVLCLLLVPGIAFSAVCKTVGEDGLVSFQNVPGSECPPGWTLTDYGTPMQSGGPVRAYEADVSGRQVPFTGYDSIQITAPEDGGTVRSNQGKVTVEVSLVPSLRQNHFVTAYLDGKAFRGRYGSNEIELTDVDRGTHTLRVKVSDSKGSVVIESEPVSFTLLKKGVEQPIVVDPVTGDDFISEQEARGSVPITGQIIDGVVVSDFDDVVVTIAFAQSDDEYQAEVDEDGRWEAVVPGWLLAEEARFVVTASVPDNEFTKAKAVSVERRGRQYIPTFDPEYSPEKPDYTPPDRGVPAVLPGQTNPAFKPNY